MTEFAAPSDLYFSAVTINLLTLLALPSATPCLSSHATCISHYNYSNRSLHLRLDVFLCIDFVRVTNCFYDYDYDEICQDEKNANRDITNRNGLVLRLCGAICRIYE